MISAYIFFLVLLSEFPNSLLDLILKFKDFYAKFLYMDAFHFKTIIFLVINFKIKRYYKYYLFYSI